MDFFWVLVFFLIVVPFGGLLWLFIAMRRSSASAHSKLLLDRARAAVAAKAERDRASGL